MPKISDIDLAGGFRLDLKTGVLLLALAAQWWDQRAQSERRAELEIMRSESVKESLTEVKQLQKVQQYDISAIKLALAEAGIKIKKGD